MTCTSAEEVEEKLRGLHSHTAHRQKLKHLFRKDKRDYIVIWQLGQTSKGSSGARKFERSAFGYHEALLQVPAEKKQDSEGKSRGPSHNNRGTIGKMVNTFEELLK